MIKTDKSQVVLAGPSGEALIRKTPGVCGGDACIRNTRIMVWLLAAYRRQGLNDAQILKNYPGLTAEDLGAAWEYERQHPKEIDQAIKDNENGEE
jgi:uncharacterized protein (DUF433 family)